MWQPQMLRETPLYKGYAMTEPNVLEIFSDYI